jgi:hypothetical protein
LDKLYGIAVSPDLISAVADAALEEVAPWRLAASREVRSEGSGVL